MSAVRDHPITVSYHATLRWLERAEGIGIEGLRMRFGFGLNDHELAKRIESEFGWDIEAARAGLASIIPCNERTADHDIDGIVFRVIEGTLITVFRRSRPRAKPRRRSHIVRNGRRPPALPPAVEWMERAG